MDFINKLFNKQKIECPRCLGKGNVDWDDIKRLKNELKWIPGQCAYCNGSGTTSKSLQSNIPVDTSYLTIDLNSEEQNKIKNGDKDSLKRAENYDIQTNKLLNEIEFLHFTGKMNPTLIADFYLLNNREEGFDSQSKNEMLDYVNNVINSKKESKDQNSKFVSNQTELNNEILRDYKFLKGLYNDSYFPPFLLDKCKSILIDLCFKIENNQTTNLDELYKFSHASTERINDLENEFYNNGSEIETGAREIIAEDFNFISITYGFDADIEELIATRNW